MKGKFLLVLSGFMVISGVVLLVLSANRPVTLLIDGIPLQTQTRSFTTGKILAEANLSLSPHDRVIPALNSFIGWNGVIQIRHAGLIQIWLPGKGVIGQYYSTQRMAANILADQGIRLYPGDEIFWNGKKVSPDQTLPFSPVYTLQFSPAQTWMIVENDRAQYAQAGYGTLSNALWQNGVRLTVSDQVSLPLWASFPGPSVITIKHAAPLLIHTSNGDIQAFSAAETVGQALVDAHISLQGTDYSFPPEDQPIPPDRQIEIVRVRESLLLEQTTIPFSREYVSDPNTELDQQAVIQVGQYGVQVTRWRLRYENENETNRFVDSDWTASLPQNELVGLGTKAVIRTVDGPNGPLEYWRAVTVYATSYSPCNSGADRCYPNTAGGAKVQQGIVAVTRSWYNLMAGQQVYIPGYGIATISDIGGGIPGRRWIDVAYTDDTYVPWHSEVTMYFLTPIPATIPYDLP